MKHCFHHWDEIARRIHAAPGIFLALDYDGVLAPIAARPELARMPEKNRLLLQRLSKHAGVRAAVISGRTLSDVRQQVNLESLLYAGNHGAEITLDGKTERHISLGRYRRELLHVKEQLMLWLERFAGLRLEDKGFGIGVHYREVDAQEIPVFVNAFASWAQELPEDLAVFPAKMMMEVRPKVEWNKGNAVLRIWEAVAPLSLPFCLGDDRTDEDGFIALKGKGINIFVGTAKESCAEFFLESTAEVTLFLERLLSEANRVFTS